MTNLHTITLAITGASGAIYGIRLLQELLSAQQSVNLLISSAAHVVIATETDYKLPSRPTELKNSLCQLFNADQALLQVFAKDQWMAPIASGSNISRAMVVCPCSSGTLSAIAHGSSNNLIERAADVTIKEKRQLILVPRETPLSVIHLNNMLSLAQIGVTILPASPGFYNYPQTPGDLIDFIVARILDHLSIPQNLMAKWEGRPKTE